MKDRVQLRFRLIAESTSAQDFSGDPSNAALVTQAGHETGFLKSHAVE